MGPLHCFRRTFRACTSLLALSLPFIAAGQSAQPPSHGILLVGAKQSRTLAMVDADTYQVLARIPVGEDPHEVVVGPGGRTAYVSHLGNGTMHILSRIDLVHRSALPDLDIAPLKGAHGIAVQGDHLWITAVQSQALGELDPGSGRMLSVIGTGQANTHMLWISRDGGKIVAANAGSGTMSILNRNEEHTLGGSSQPALAPDWQQTLLPVGQKAEGFAVSPDEREAWVGNADGTITVLDLTSDRVAATFNAGTVGANRLRFTPDGARVIATTHTGKDLVVLDAHTHELVKLVPIEERGASGIQVSPDGHRAFIACPRDHFVAVVDLRTLERIATIDAGKEPDGITWWDGGR